MVQKFKEEQGYALVTVLLIFVVLMVLMISFSTISGTTIKQNERSEEKQQATALAEMGVEYFQHAVENLFIDIKDEVENSTFEMEEPFLVIQEFAKILQDKLTMMKLHDHKIVPHDSKFSEAYYQIQFNPENDISAEDEKIVIRFISIGKMDTSETKINTEITMNFENRIHFVENGNEENDDDLNDSENFDYIIKNKNDFDQFNGKEIQNKKILIVDSLNNIQNRKFHFSNSVLIARKDNECNNGNSLTIQFFKDSDLKITDHSIFNVCGKLHINNNAALVLENNSKIYVDEFHINSNIKQLVIQGNSKIHVNTLQITAGKQDIIIKDTSRICVDEKIKGNPNNVHERIIPKKINGKDNENYFKECMDQAGNNPRFHTVNIDNPRLSFNYNYN